MEPTSANILYMLGRLEAKLDALVDAQATSNCRVETLEAAVSDLKRQRSYDRGVAASLAFVFSVVVAVGTAMYEGLLVPPND